MLALLAAALAATSPSPSPPTAEAEAVILDASVPWWEKITVTMDDKGKQQSCLYLTSYSGAGAASCDEEMAASVPARGDAQPGLFSKLTFERRFSPGGKLDSGRLQPGDELLGRQVMYLTLDADGSILSCEVVSVSGRSPGHYDCDEVRKEKFQAETSTGSTPRQAFMTVLAYGHMEELS